MKITVAISTIKDGNMLVRNDIGNFQVQQNRSSFLAKHDIDIKQTTCVNVMYEGSDYNRYYEVTEAHKSNGMYNQDNVAADGLVTRAPNHALFLPIADCIGAVIFDPTKNILMLSHLGRHSLEQNGGFESVNFFTKHYGCKPQELKVWLTPAPGPDVYPMFGFNDRSIKSVVFQQLGKAGIKEENITDNPTDTSKDPELYSHSEFLKGRQTEDGRYAIVTMMQE